MRLGELLGGTMVTLEQIRQIVHEELGKGQGVDLEFRELIEIPGGDSFLPREDWVKPDIYTQAEELEKLTRGEPLALAKHAGGWDEEVGVPLAKSEMPHPDGIEIEKHGNQTWYWHWQGGELVKSTLQDPDLGVMHFDGEGNELAV
jgi:hypothetical protein